jgi:hypothetical protein
MGIDDGGDETLRTYSSKWKCGRRGKRSYQAEPTATKCRYTLLVQGFNLIPFNPFSLPFDA